MSSHEEQRERERDKPRWRERSEVVTTGYDPNLQLIGDAWGTPNCDYLRVPNLAHVRYRFLLAMVRLSAGDVLLGYRNKTFTIGHDPLVGGEDSPAPPAYPLPFEVTTSDWRFQDGQVTTTITVEPTKAKRAQKGPLDQRSFTLRDSNQSALTYLTATFPARAPDYITLISYAPPAMCGRPVFVARNLKAPWRDYTRFHIYADRAITVRLYCDVFQTDPTTRPPLKLASPTPIFVVSGLPPEENYLQLFPSPAPVRYYGVAGALLYRRELEAMTNAIPYPATDEQRLMTCPPGWEYVESDPHVRAAAAGMLGELPPYHYANKVLATGLYRFFAFEDPNYGRVVAAMRFAGGRPQGDLGDPPPAEDDAGDGQIGDAAIGQTSGDAVVVTGVVAENAAQAWTDNGGTISPPSDVFDLLTPGNQISGIAATEYAQFKSPPNAQLWKYEPQNNAGYFQATGVNQSLLSPIPGTPGTSTTTTTTTTSSGSSAGTAVAVVAGVVVVGGVLAYVLTR